VEIGPGLGDLTQKLVKYKDVTAYEVDRDLYAILTDKFKHEIKSGKLKINLIDVLEAWKKQTTLYDGKYDLIANLPYYIATNIILKAYEDANCESIIVMIQKEVANKFSAKVGEKEFGALSVITEYISEFAKIIIDVPPESFDPAPKVDSSVLYVKKKKDVCLDERFNKFLKSAFSQPRKKLFKNLTPLIDKGSLSSIYKELDIDENARPHEVSASLYHHLYKKVILDDNKR
jgi:16S rRNA (adenine1518-N6/adenine1519-N6)-dimethyltransferase